MRVFFPLQARWLGCLNFNISPWNGAAAAVYVCLAQLAFIPVFLSAAGVPVTRGKEEQNDGALPVCLHAVTDRWGRNSVALTPFYAWPEYKEEGLRLVDRCERLYQSYVTAGGKLQQE
jgi:3-keto steroid reductase